MGTSSETIVDLFFMRVQDYKINTIYNTSGSFTAVQYAEPWLIDAIVMFTPYSKESLAYTPSTDTTTGYFDANLSMEVQNILSQIMVLYWLKREVNNLLSMNRFVADRDFRMTAPNLPSMKEYSIVKSEEIDKLIADYSYRYVDWATWQNQIFSASASSIA